MVHFDLLKIENELKKLEEETIKDGFWNDSKNSSLVLQKIKSLKGKFSKYNDIRSELDNLIEVKTAGDLQEVAEYVWGLFSIWGRLRI